MMQSAALCDSHQIETLDDFVLVQQPEQLSFDLVEEEENWDDVIEIEDQDDDLESYDYCDDAYSNLTGDQSVSLDLVMTVDTHQCCIENAEQDEEVSEIVLTVPTILLKDLDDAHAAAKLADIPDVEQNLESSSSAFSCSATKRTHVDKVDMDHPKVLVGNHEEVEDIDNKISNNKNGNATIPLKENDKTTKTLEEHSDDSSLTNGGNLSRTSNKKRRKKLKLMKKAMAAANAAQALSERTRSSSRSTDTPNNSKVNKKTKKKTTTTRAGVRSSKRVANIAVACATETLSAYRHELAKKMKTKIVCFQKKRLTVRTP